MTVKVIVTVRITVTVRIVTVRVVMVRVMIARVVIVRAVMAAKGCKIQGLQRRYIGYYSSMLFTCEISCIAE